MNDITFRSLRPGDLPAVVEIDAVTTGRTRRNFFEKRLDAALANPDGFVTAAIEKQGDGKKSGPLIGYAIARLQHGEYGDDQWLATLDVIGMDPEWQHKKLGTRLLDTVRERLKKNGVGELRTHVDWHDRGLLGFFSAAGFELAPRHVLERATDRDI